MLNKTLLFARYANYLTLCLRAALSLDLITRHDKDTALSFKELAELLGIDPIAGRSFFNVLVALEILIKRDGGYIVPEEAYLLLSEGKDLTLAPYLSLGLQSDTVVQEFVQFLRNPKSGQILYSADATRCVMDEPDGVAKAIAYGLASRARRFAHALAHLIANRAKAESLILDIGAGSPFLARELIAKMPGCAVTLADHANATRFIQSIAKENKIELQSLGTLLSAGQIGVLQCNMFQRETLPRVFSADVIVFSNVLHDWSPLQIPTIINNAAACLKPMGTIVVHEAFLSDANPVEQQWMAAYGMALNHLTAGQGSCYFPLEYDQMFERAGFKRNDRAIETRDGCMVLFYEKIQ